MLPMDSSKRKIIISLLEGLAYLVLCIASVLILKGVFGQFLSEDSTFKIYDGKIDEYPTITICTPKHELSYGADLNLTFRVVSSWSGDSNHLDVGENIIDGSHHREEIVKLEEIYSYVISGFCYKITRIMDQEIITMNDGWTSIKLNLNKSIANNELPDFDFYITSEKNSLGAVYYEWMEGDELNIKIRKVSII